MSHRQIVVDIAGLFPAEAGPTNAPRAASEVLCEHECGTGFSREGVSSHTAKLGVLTLASSRLKPVLQNNAGSQLIQSVQPGR